MDLGRSRRPDTASQLRLAPPKRLTMEEEEEEEEEKVEEDGIKVEEETNATAI